MHIPIWKQLTKYQITHRASLDSMVHEPIMRMAVAQKVIKMVQHTVFDALMSTKLSHIASIQM